MKYLILFFLLLGCSQKIHFKPGYSTPELREIVKDFEEDFDVKILYEVVFVKEFTLTGNPNRAAVCLKQDDYTRVEILDIYEFSDFLEAIVYHENGHCQLGIEHYTKTIDIMNPILNYDVVFNFEFYRDQMLNNYLNHIYLANSIKIGYN